MALPPNWLDIPPRAPKGPPVNPTIAFAPSSPAETRSLDKAAKRGKEPEVLVAPRSDTMPRTRTIVYPGS